MLLRRCDNVFVPKRGTHACSKARSVLGSEIRPVSDIQHATIRSALERKIPSCPVIGFGRPYSVIFVPDTSVESGCVLGVDGGGSCLRQGYLLGAFSRKRYVLSNHICGCIRIIAVFVKNKSRSNLIRSVSKLLSCGHASCTCSILCRRTGGRHCAFAVVRSLLVLSSVVVGPPTTDAMVEQGICPCPCPCPCRCPCPLPFPFPLSFPNER